MFRFGETEGGREKKRGEEEGEEERQTDLSTDLRTTLAEGPTAHHPPIPFLYLEVPDLRGSDE